MTEEVKSTHVKPTQEELEANAQRAAKEAEELVKKAEENSLQDSEIKIEEVITVDPSDLSDRQKSFLEEHKEELSPELREKYGLAVEESVVEKTEEEIKIQEEEEEKVKKEKEKKEEQERIDWEAKFKNSALAAQHQMFKNKEMEKAVEDGEKITDISEEELKKEYPEWEMMDDIQRKLAKDNLINKKRFSLINQANLKFKEVQVWYDTVKKFVKDPQILANNPELEGKENDFIFFCTDNERRSGELDHLLSTFLRNTERFKRPKQKGKMMETGSDGANVKPKPKSDKLTFEQGQLLKKQNYNDYIQKLKDGKIEDLSE